MINSPFDSDQQTRISVYNERVERASSLRLQENIGISLDNTSREPDPSKRPPLQLPNRPSRRTNGVSENWALALPPAQ
jgi:hypothetical protein